ncbi:hypothetical protein ACHAXA_006532 [Cyclostephanos tholiformis]|uniref:Actin n=1 Tax=Cyclostephanos tholiformis TaxID=382380 RepID=A0ABD3RBD0_9STRA
MSTYYVGKDAQALVCDIGSFSTKVGYAGDDHPHVIFGSTTAIERRRRVGSGSGGSNFTRGPRRDFLTRCCDEGRDDDGDFELANPINPITGWVFSPPPSSMSSNEGTVAGIDVNNDHDAWESHELVGHYLRHAFRDSLGLDLEGSKSGGMSCHHPLLLLDKPHSPPALRQRLVEVLFESHDLPAVFLLRDAVASCYAVGRTTGTVVDFGHSATMVTPVHEGFVETRGVRRNVGCGAANVDERVLGMLDEVVRVQGGRRRKDRIRRINQRKYERSLLANSNSAFSSQNANVVATVVGGCGGEGENSPCKPQTSAGGVKRDAAGHFVREISNQPISAPVPDYLMPLYQVRRAPNYATRSTPFHNWCRLALAREIKEMGLGVAVGPMGYVPSVVGATIGGASFSATAIIRKGGDGADAERGGGAIDGGGVNSSINPASANSVFLTSAKLTHVLPDGTSVEISTSSRCDIVELYFGNDEYNAAYREEKFDEAVRTLEKYECDIEEFLAEKDGGGEAEGGAEGTKSARIRGSVRSTSGSIAGDPYSSVSYRGEKFTRHPGRIGAGSGGFGKSSKYYAPNTISRKLYSATLPYIRTVPPNINNGEGCNIGGSGGLSKSNSGLGVANSSLFSTGASVDANFFHYLTSSPPAQMVCDAAFRCDRDQQASLLGNVVVCGGGACVTGATGVVSSTGQAGGVGGGGETGGGGLGAIVSLLGDEFAFPDRLREEIEAIVHRHTPNWRVKVTSPNVSERAICSWLGGSILGSLGTFQDMWISRKDYDEFGPAIINRKCP